MDLDQGICTQPTESESTIILPHPKKIANKVGSAERQRNPAMYFRRPFLKRSRQMLWYHSYLISCVLSRLTVHAYFLIAGTEVGLFCTRKSSAIIPSPLMVKYKATILWALRFLKKIVWSQTNSCTTTHASYLMEAGKMEICCTVSYLCKPTTWKWKLINRLLRNCNSPQHGRMSPNL